MYASKFLVMERSPNQGCKHKETGSANSATCLPCSSKPEKLRPAADHPRGGVYVHVHVCVCVRVRVRVCVCERRHSHSSMYGWPDERDG